MSDFRYRVYKMEIRKNELPSYFDGNENYYSVLAIVTSGLYAKKYADRINLLLECDAINPAVSDIDKIEEITENFCLECVRKEHGNDTLSAVWVSNLDANEDDLPEIEEIFVDNGDGTIAYDYMEWDQTACGWLDGNEMTLYDKETDTTILLAITDTENGGPYEFKAVFRYSGFPNECITNAYMETRRAEKDAEPDTSFLK